MLGDILAVEFIHGKRIILLRLKDLFGTFHFIYHVLSLDECSCYFLNVLIKADSLFFHPFSCDIKQTEGLVINGGDSICDLYGYTIRYSIAKRLKLMD